MKLNNEAKSPSQGKPPSPSELKAEAMMREIKTLLDDTIMKVHSLREKLFFYMVKPPNKIQTLQFQINANLLKARQILERLEHGRISQNPSA